MMGQASGQTDKQGLSSPEARDRLMRDGPNELPRARRRSMLRIATDVLREPMLAMLLAAGAVYAVLGDLGEASILLLFATFSIALTIVQSSRTEHVLDALKDLSAPRALVIRDGTPVRIAGQEVVEGDVLLLEQGDRVAADAILSAADNLQADESLLTGESVPVGKVVAGAVRVANEPAGGDNRPNVYAGSLITRGSGIARVVATGPRSAIGRIGATLSLLAGEPPRLQSETKRVVMLCAIGGAGIAVLVVVLSGLLRGDWLAAILSGLTIGMTMLPEEFPVVLTVFLAMGAWRIAQARVLTRSPAAIETLGATTVLCTDKTGTLTQNRMAVATLWLPSGSSVRVSGQSAIAEEFHALIDTSILASAPVPTDPMEIAFHDAGAAFSDHDTAVPARTLACTYGLTPELLAMSNIWTDPNPARSQVVAAKGAPEAIAALCGLSSEERSRMAACVDEFAAQGMRVLAVARANLGAGLEIPASQFDHDFELFGLVGLADPLRPSVPAAVAECQQAGIRIVMITGDYPVTARAIATQAGIAAGDILTGGELDRLTDHDLADRLGTVTVFARIMPEQKLRIVEAFKARGDVVAMTGDGVNDAPSLKAAHIGVAMGKRGTDVAREASAIVLLDDDFGAIVEAVRLGRRIYDNIKKAMAFIFAVHVPIAGLALLPLFTGLPLLFGPVHIALLEMIIDPVCALVFEAEAAEPSIMDRKPRDPRERLMSLSMISWSMIQGGIAFLCLGLLHLVLNRTSAGEETVRAVLFFSLVGAILALILINRSFATSFRSLLGRENLALRYVTMAIVGGITLVLALPDLRHILRFAALGPDQLFIAGITITIILLLLEGCKAVQHGMPRDGR